MNYQTTSALMWTAFAAYLAAGVVLGVRATKVARARRGLLLWAGLGAATAIPLGLLNFSLRPDAGEFVPSFAQLEQALYLVRDTWGASLPALAVGGLLMLTRWRGTARAAAFLRSGVVSLALGGWIVELSRAVTTFGDSHFRPEPVFFAIHFVLTIGPLVAGLSVLILDELVTLVAATQLIVHRSMAARRAR